MEFHTKVLTAFILVPTIGLGSAFAWDNYNKDKKLKSYQCESQKLEIFMQASEVLFEPSLANKAELHWAEMKSIAMGCE